MSSDSVTELSEGEFQKFIEDKKSKLVVVDFFAEWCMPCVMMSPILEETAEELGEDKVKFGKINVDEARETSMKYQISSIPCIVFLKDGKEVGRSIGAVNVETLKARISEHL